MRIIINTIPILTIFLIEIFFINNSFSQFNNVKVLYSLKADLKQDSTVVVNERTQRMIDLMRNEINSMDMKLLIKNNKSSFTLKEEMEIDDRREYLRKRTIAIFNLKGEYFYDIKEKTVVKEFEFDGLNYHITSNFSDLKWKLIDQTKKIGKYLCYKAVTTTYYKSRKGEIQLEVVAWFTPEIPIPLGPKNYVGLPGLILELEEGKDRLRIVVNHISLNDILNISRPKKGVIVSQFEFDSIVSNSTSKYINSMK